MPIRRRQRKRLRKLQKDVNELKDDLKRIELEVAKMKAFENKLPDTDRLL